MSDSGRERFWVRWSSYSGAQFRSGLQRVRGALVPNTQAAVFATISWVLCRLLFGDPNPIFAPIATYICLGFTRNREPRKVVEVGLGASAGVLIGGVVANHWGFGFWQLLVLLLVTPLIARFLDRSELVTFQTGVNAIVVASMLVFSAGTPGTGPIDRWTNALVGAGVALLATVVLPTNVVTRPRRYVAFTVLELSRYLRLLSKGLLDGDTVAIAHLAGRLTAMRELLNDGRRALTSAQETAAISPAAYGSRAVLAELDRMIELSERLHVTLSMMQRQARGMVGEVGAIPEIAKPMWQAADLLEAVAKGVSDWQRPTDARNAALQLAGSLGPDEFTHGAGDWRSATLASLLRAVVVDLLELTGLSMAQARAALADTGDYDPDHEEDLAEGAELASDLWGTERLPVVDEPGPPRDGGSGRN